MEQIKKQLEEISFIQLTYYEAHYILLKERHLIIQNQKYIVFKLLSNVKKSYSNIITNESNILPHIYKIYYISDRANVTKQRQSIPIRFLKKINMNVYGNEEYYYHLAIA